MILLEKTNNRQIMVIQTLSFKQIFFLSRYFLEKVQIKHVISTTDNIIDKHKMSFKAKIRILENSYLPV